MPSNTISRAPFMSSMVMVSCCFRGGMERQDGWFGTNPELVRTWKLAAAWKVEMLKMIAVKYSVNLYLSDTTRGKPAPFAKPRKPKSTISFKRSCSSSSLATSASVKYVRFTISSTCSWVMSRNRYSGISSTPPFLTSSGEIRFS